MWDFRIVDVFTERPLAGNESAVFEDATSIPEPLLQALAQEIGYSETVFADPAQNGGDARVRIFTPTAELPFAGHPVLGTAVVVATKLGKDRVVLETGRGPSRSASIESSLNTWHDGATATNRRAL